ncbi:unnamed protein product [Calypogeia fissa]
MKQCTMMKVQLLFVVSAILGSGLRGAAAAAPAKKEVSHRAAGEYIQIHGWLMWVSMGFLFPLGAILIRFNRGLTDSNSLASPARARLLLYLHSTVQCGGVGCATAGIAILIKEFGPTFFHTHMKLGLALWIITMIMPVISIVRPAKGTQGRPIWLFVHWLLGTGVIFLGVVNCYIGIEIYQFHHGSIRSLDIAFSVQVAVMAFVYFLQDRFSYILGQGSKHAFQSASKVASRQSMKIEAVLATP